MLHDTEMKQSLSNVYRNVALHESVLNKEMSPSTHVEYRNAAINM